MVLSLSIDCVLISMVFCKSCTPKSALLINDIKSDGVGSGYCPTPTFTTRKFFRSIFKAMVAAAIAYKVGLFAQYPPSASSTVSPSEVVTIFLEKNGYAEHEAWTASEIVQPKPGANVPNRP